MFESGVALYGLVISVTPDSLCHVSAYFYITPHSHLRIASFRRSKMTGTTTKDGIAGIDECGIR